jgi:hypothetical protein
MVMDDRVIKQKHAEYDKTRCGAWLAATGHRPIGGVRETSLAKSEVPVVKVARPAPECACDVHPS